MSHLCTLGLIFTILLFGISYANASETIPFVSTFAGTDTRGDIDDSALNSTFHGIYDMELDTNGDMYVVDYFNRKIRIIYSNGTVSTYVDGRALDASFIPHGIELDHSGNLYVTDYRNHKIRIIHSNGTVSTYAGTGVYGALDGPALSATFSFLDDIELDPHGNLYVADSDNNKIRIIYSNGTVSTYAGTGASGSLDGPALNATFNYPRGLELDPHGNLYVADSNKIRIIYSNGTVSTYAGTGARGSLDGPALNATFYRPFGLELDSSGNLYVADTGNKKIRIIHSNGTVSTFAGTGGYGSLDGPALNATFYTPLGLELDSSGNLYVSTIINIRKITTNSLPFSPPPIITLIGDNPQIIGRGLNYTELGATTNDDSIITINDSSVDTNTLGNYTVIYYTIGDSGNIESLVNRTVIIRDLPILYTLLLNDTFDSTLDDWQFFGATGYQATHSSEHGGSAYVFGEDALKVAGIEKNITIPYASSENFVLDGDLLLSLDFRVKATTTDSSVTNSRIAVYDSLTNEPLYYEYLVRGKYLDTEWRSFNINLDSYVADHNSITIKLLLSDSWHALYEQQNWFDNILLEVMPDNNEPVITLFGNNPQNTSLGYGYVELGAMTDDGSPIVINNTEFIDAIGTYSIYYDSTDLVGNNATQVVRTVNVVDTITLYHYTFTSTTEDWEYVGNLGFTTSHDSEHGGSLHIHENTVADDTSNFGSQKIINISKASDVLVLSFDYKIEANPGDDTISLTIYDSVTLDSLYSTIVTSGVPETGWRSFSQDIYPYVNNSDSIIISLSIRGGFNNYDLYPNGWFDNIKLDTVYVEPVIGTIPFVSTFAGTDTRGDIDDSALNSTFNEIYDIELDTNGDMYVVDYFNRKIRIIYSNGTVSTYVDGRALDASFIPHGIELDHSGNLYVTDYRNHKIRIIHSNGTVSTYAGTGVYGALDGPALSATFSFLDDIELDPHGNLYVADSDNNKIRIIYSNGTVSTYAGTGASGSLDGPALNATFNYPIVLELDPHGNLYVADSNKIRIIYSNGTVSTYAGTGARGSLDGPALNATFYYPSGLELDSSGNLYVADASNHKIRIIYSNGTVSTFAGTGGYGSLDGPALNATFNYPIELELDSSGNLYVSTNTNIRKITTNSLPFSPPPIITLIGDNPQIIERGLNYTELGATINDNSIITINDSSVDTNTLGNYTVIYYTIGDSGNIESLVNRTVIIRDLPILYTLLLNDTFDSTLDDWQFFGTTRYQATHSSEHGGSAHVFGEAVNKVVGIEKNITIPYASSENFVLDGDLLLSLDFRAKSTHTGSSVTNSRIAVYDSLTNELLYYEYLVRGKYLDTEWRSFNINLDSYVADHNSITIKLLLSDSWHALYEQQNWFDNILLEVMPDNSEPVITLFGNNPQNTSLGYGYVELGAMTDDGSPIVINNTEFIDAIGTYSIYYDSTDLLGNDATQVVRTVNVVDTITLYHYTFTSTTEDWEHIGNLGFTTSHDSEHGGSLHIHENTVADDTSNFGSQKIINISKASDVLVLSFDYKIEANPGDDTISLTIYDSVTLDSLYSTIVTSGVPETGWRSFSQDIYPYVNNSDSIIISLSIRGGFNNYDLYPNGWFDNIKLDTVYVEPVIGTIPFVSTFAGTDTRGDIDDSALNSTFYGIYDIELDTNGDMYVADGFNGKIRIIYSNGTVSTYVDGRALDASFTPYGIELDPHGNLYVADSGNHKIRIIYSNGTVSTYAGTGARGSLDGPASSATFDYPQYIELDPHGNLYVTDTGNNKIRIIHSNGTVSTYAGTGGYGSLDGPALNATFYYPFGLELDSSGNLYVTDTGNNKIRIIHSNGTVSTYAGTDGYGSLDGPALNATFRDPFGLELDSSGNLYVADASNNKIRIIYSNGTVSTFAGTGARGSLDGPALNATFYYPSGLELDSSGNLYVSTLTNIRKITTNSLPPSPLPIITLIGDNPQIIERGLNYTELGATTNDDSIITINDSSVDTNTLGNYTVIYYTIGDSGNIESLVNRTVIIRDSPILYTLLLNDTFDSTLDDWQFFGDTGYQAIHSSEHGGSAHVFGEDVYTMVGIEKNITIPYASSENFVLDGDLLLSFDFRAKSTHIGPSVTNSRIAVYDSLTNEILYDEYLVRGKYFDTEWRSFNINLDSYVADHNSITIKLLLRDSGRELYEHQNWFDNILLEVMPDINEPVITLFGNNPQNTSLGYGYVELGAMTDDGSPIVINNTEFIDAIGTYSIYYDSTDLLGNDATQVVRTVNVVDTITLYHYTFTSTTEDWEHIGNLGFTTSHDSEHGGSLHIHENTVADDTSNFGSQKIINISKASDVLVLSFDYKIEANPGDDTISLTIYDSVTLDSLYSTIVTSGVPETGWRSFSQDIYPYVNNSDSIIVSLSIRGGFNNYDLYPNGWFDNIKLDTVYVEPVIGTIPFVSTFAGTNTAGDIDDSALNSTFSVISDIELDTNGDMYVVDGFNGKIRIIYSNGTVSTYVDGRALDASFTPYGIKLGHSGNLYVTDYRNHKILIIYSNGTVSTYAGTGVSGSLDGPALNATFYHPFGLELDSSGNLYVTDTGNNKIRIIYSNGTVSTYAGTGARGSLDGPASSATFVHPQYIELDPHGNLYVTDSGNHKIRIIYSNGTVSTYAGTGARGSLDGPALNATFYYPSGLELDSSGNLYVADASNHKIRIIYSNGTVSTFAGTGGYGSLDGPALNATFYYPSGLELDSSGNLYVSTLTNIRKITTNSLPPSPLPIITLIGDNPQIIERGLNYTELGATTNDNSIITINDSSVDTNTLGNYTVIYYTIGDSGNIESLVNRTVIIRDLPILYTLLLNDTFDSTLDDWQFFGTTGYQATHSSEHGGSAYVFGEDAYTMVGIEKNITIPYASSENFVLDGDLLLSFDFRAKSTTFDSSVTNSRITVYDSLTNELLYDEYLVRGKYLDTEWRSFNINLDSYVADHNSITIKLLLSDSWLSQHRQQNWFDNILLEVMPDISEPVITLLGNNPQNTSLGYGYVELGAMTDDGSPIVINNTEFIDAIGTYSIYYDSTDLVGNNATQVVRTVNVVDTITLYHYTFTSTTEDWEHIGSSSFTTSHDSEHGGSLHIYENTIADGINNFGSQKIINISKASDVLVLSFDYKIEANPGEDVISLTIYDSVTLDSLYSTIVTSGVPETGWRSFSQDIYPYVNNSDSIIISLSIRDGFSIYNLYPHGWFDNIKLDTVYVESVIDTTPPIITLIGDNPQIIERGLNYTELGATTNDNSIITINDSSVDTNTLGNYTVIYYTIGDFGNIESLVNRTVIIRDLPILYTLLLNDTFDSTLDDWQFFGTTGYQATHSSEHGGSAYVFGEDAYTMVGIEKNITIPYASSENFVLDGDLLLSFDFRAKSTTFDSSVTNSRITVYDSLTNELLYDEYLVRGKYLDTEWRSFNINLDSYVADHNSITIKLLLSDSWLSQHRQQNWFDNILLEVMPDISEPVITLLGNNPQNTSLGYGYVELGAMTDDGSPIVINNTEFIDAIGTYSIYYDSTDLVGNNATQVVRTVNVVDTITLYHYTFTSTTEDWEHIGSSSFTTSHDSEHGGSLHIYENTIADGINNFGSQKIINISKASDVLVLSFDYKIEANPGEDIISLTIYDSVTLDSLYSTIVTSGVPETGWRSFSQDIYPYVNNSDSIIISLSIRDGFSIYNLYPHGWFDNIKLDTVYVESVIDTTPPIITLIGDNPQIIERGLNYTELGATTNDNSIITINDSSVDTNTLGNYTVIYYTIGDFGNIESLVNRTVIIRDLPILYTLLLNDTFDSTLDDWQFFGTTGYQATHSSEHGGSAYVFGEDAYTMVGIEKNITIPYASSENFVLDGDLLLSFDFRAKSTTFDSSVTNSRITVYDSLTNELLYDEYLVRGKYLDTEWRSFNINLDSYVADHNSITIKLLLSDSWLSQHRQQNWFDNILLEVMPDISEPVITLLGNNPQNTSLGYGYVELGAMTDDGSPIVINNTEFIDAIGTYSIYYDSTDLVGNNATQVVRTVNVVDTITLYHYTFTSTTEDWEHIGSSSFTTSHDSEHGGSLHIYENTIADGINNFGSQKIINISKASDVLVLSFDYKIEANPGEDVISLTIYDSVTLDSLYSTIVTSGVPETGWRSFSQDIYPYVNNSDSIIISLSIRDGFSIYNLYPHGWFDNIKLDTVYVE